MGPISYSFEELVAHKESGKVPAAAIENLRSQVDEILTKPTFKVTEIDIPRPSGDMHDYMSVSPYRWPNPDTPDGLPWVRRDGHHNPNTARNPRGAAPYGRVHRLALAALYFPEKAKEYAEYANRQMYDWFLNPDSYMKPNAKYAQSIPGVCDGCSPGIIDFANTHLLVDGMGILEELGLLDMEIKEGVKQWFVEFTNWLMTDGNGINQPQGRRRRLKIWQRTLSPFTPKGSESPATNSPQNAKWSVSLQRGLSMRKQSRSSPLYTK